LSSLVPKLLPCEHPAKYPGGVATVATVAFVFLQDEGYFLWKLVDSVSGPLEVAVELATRYEACELLEPSIALTRFTLRQVELVLERDDDEYLGRSWKISEGLGISWNILIL
jgi:hypothetical protein